MNNSCCTPDCKNKTCGDNGCGGSCGTCTSGMSCNENGQCQGDACATATVCNTSADCGSTACGTDHKGVGSPMFCSIPGGCKCTRIAGGFLNICEYNVK